MKCGHLSTSTLFRFHEAICTSHYLLEVLHTYGQRQVALSFFHAVIIHRCMHLEKHVASLVGLGLGLAYIRFRDRHGEGRDGVWRGLAHGTRTSNHMVSGAIKRGCIHFRASSMFSSLMKFPRCITTYLTSPRQTGDPRP